MIVWLNNTFLDDALPAVPATAAGMLTGWGCYSTLGVRGGQPLHLARHLVRLRANAARLNVESAFSDEEIGSALAEIIARNEVVSGIARLTLTQRGEGRWNTESGSHFLIVAQNAKVPPLSGLHLIISPFRFEARRPLAGIKSTSCDYQMAWQNAHAQGFDDAILLNQNGALCETARANVFWVRGGELFTPSLECGCLPGITRELIIENAPELGLFVREGAFSPQELRMADEVFITSATNGPRGIVSVRFDEEESFIGGEITRRLQAWWHETTQ